VPERPPRIMPKGIPYRGEHVAGRSVGPGKEFGPAERARMMRTDPEVRQLEGAVDPRI
jgi:hypothetical protein